MLRTVLTASVLLAASLALQSCAGRRAEPVAAVEGPALFRLAGAPRCQFTADAGLEALRMSDSRFIGTNFVAGMLQTLDCSGRVLSSAGESGTARPMTETFPVVRFKSDSFLVSHRSYASVFSGEGKFARHLSHGRVQCSLADGAVVVEEPIRSRSARAPRRARIRYLRYPADSAMPPDTLGEFPGMAWLGLNRVALTPVAGSGVARLSSVLALPLPLGARTRVACDGGRILIGDPATDTLLEFGARGTPPRRLPLGGSPRRVTVSHRKAYVEDQTYGHSADAAADRRRQLRDVEFADTLPAFRDMHVDPLHRVWLEMFPESRDRHVTWRVLSADGAFAGTVSIPRGLKVLSIERSEVILSRREPGNRSTIFVYALIPPT